MSVFHANPDSKPIHERQEELAGIVKDLLTKQINQIVEREANEAAERVRQAIKEKAVIVSTAILASTNVRISKITNGLEIIIQFNP